MSLILLPAKGIRRSNLYLDASNEVWVQRLEPYIILLKLIGNAE
jgi:hypothetical protein